MGYIGQSFYHPGVQGLYNFEGNSNDASPNSFNGVDTAMNYGQSHGRIGQGAQFVQASSSKITLGTHTELVFDADFTINILAKPSATQPDTYARIFDSGHALILFTDGGAFDDGWGWELVVDANGGPNTVLYDLWQMLTVTRIGSTVSLYLNGKLLGTATKTGDIGSGDFFFGSQGGSGRYINADMDSAYLLKGTGWTAAQVLKWYAWLTGRYL